MFQQKAKVQQFSMAKLLRQSLVSRGWENNHTLIRADYHSVGHDHRQDLKNHLQRVSQKASCTWQIRTLLNNQVIPLILLKSVILWSKRKPKQTNQSNPTSKSRTHRNLAQNSLIVQPESYFSTWTNGTGRKLTWLCQSITLVT